MKVLVIVCCAFTALCLDVMVAGVGGNGGGWQAKQNESSKVKVAYLTQGAWKMCLEADMGSIAPSKKTIDLMGFIHVSNIETIAQYCDDFRLSHHVDDFLIVIPDRVGSKCYHFNDCYASIVVVNDKLVVGNAKCYNLLQGHYYHDQGVLAINEFRISNMKARGVICNYDELDAIIRQKTITKSEAVGDIFSPVEDLINDAVEKVTTVANQASEAITNQLNEIQESVTVQINTVTNVVKEESTQISRTVTEGFTSVTGKLEQLSDDVVKDVGLFERYAHIIMHIFEFLGVCWVLSWLYKLDRKATKMVNLFKWIWSKIHPGHPQPAINQNQVI